MKDLLIIACSATKKPGPDPIPAIERYDGPVYQVLQKAKKEGRWPDQLEILIVSAEYGLIKADELIDFYDCKMAPARAEELRPPISEKKGGLVDHVLLKLFKQEAQRYRVKWNGRPDHICCWPVDQDRVSLHLLGYEEGTPGGPQDLRLLAPPMLLHLSPARPWKGELMFPKIKSIDWKARGDPIGLGGLAVVYRVSPGVAAKVGRIDREEVQAQDYFARRLKAVPVWDFEEDWECPQTVAKEICPVHGIRPKEGILDPDQHFCTCYGSQDVLLMPEADDSWIDPQSTEYQAFKLGFLEECDRELGRRWDARPNNVARYLGNMVALDFGEEEC